MILIIFCECKGHSETMNHLNEINEIYFTDKHIKQEFEMQSIICFPREKYANAAQ